MPATHGSVGEKDVFVLLLCFFRCFAMAHDALICRKPFVSYIHQFLKLPFGGGGSLVELVLQGLDRFIQWRNAFLQFLEGAADIFGRSEEHTSELQSPC